MFGMYQVNINILLDITYKPIFFTISEWKIPNVGLETNYKTQLELTRNSLENIVLIHRDNIVQRGAPTLSNITLRYNNENI